MMKSNLVRFISVSDPDYNLASLKMGIVSVIYLFIAVTLTNGKVHSLNSQTSIDEYQYAYREVIMKQTIDVAPQRNNLKGSPGNGYSMDIEIGNPPQKLNVLVDTGSSNFALASSPNPSLSTYYNINLSTTYSSLHKDIGVKYTVGEWSGVLGEDAMHLPLVPEVVFRANIASIMESNDFFINNSYWQGILGLAYADIAMPDSSIEPFFDSFVRQMNISNIFGIQLCGILEDNDDENNGTASLVTGGTLTLGGVDTTLYSSKVYYTPLRQKWYYEVVITNMKINNQSLGMDCKEYNYEKTIVDSGTTSLHLPTTVFNAVVDQIQQEIILDVKEITIPNDFWSSLDILCRSTTTSDGPIWDYFPFLSISLQGMKEGEEFELTITPKQYLKPVEVQDGRTGCYKFGIVNSTLGTVLGVTLMEGFYVVFDRQNEKIGFAESTCAKSQCLNGDDCSFMAPVINGPLKTDAIDCGYHRVTDSSSAMMIVAYIMLGLCIICLSPIVLMYLHASWRKHCRATNDYARHYDNSDNNDEPEEESVSQQPGQDDG